MITEIEQRLLSCNADKFANLCRLYLSYKYAIINSTGFVSGKEKSKRGTPDNFISVKDDYIFNEITTQQTELAEKLKKDIQHCFKQRNVPAEKIIKIILICNSKITTTIQEELNKHKNVFNSDVDLELIGLDAFATIIFKEYPSIARELGLAIDTGQILEPNDFIDQYEKSKFATPLSNEFFNREKELAEGMSLLEHHDTLIISGQAGVGKTKFSLALVGTFSKKHDDYKVKYIKSNGALDIWDDLKVQLVPGENYLIVVDDANKLKTNLDLIINFRNAFNGGMIKLIFTARNYVQEEIQGKLSTYKNITLNNFERAALNNILQSPDFNITEYYFDKIFSISKGNPRIAIMAALAGIHGEIEKLNNAALILDEYFSSVNRQLNAGSDLIKTAGVLALYRTINLHHTKSIAEIDTYFKISPNDLLENLTLLHKYELADEYNGSYKIADQILGEYIFYLVFIKQKQLPFSLLLDLFIDEGKFSLIKLLTPIVSNYGFEEIKLQVIADLKRKWSNISDDPSKSLKFLKDFWFYMPTESLVSIARLLAEQHATDLHTLPFEIYNHNQLERYQDDIIDILVNFQEFPDKFILSLDLLMKYGLSGPVPFTKLLKVFTQSFTYGRYDYNSNYLIQTKLFEYLYNKSKGEDDEFYAKIILFIAHKYLVDSYQSVYGDGDIIYLGQRLVYLMEAQKDFRTRLWNFIFGCYKNPVLRPCVYDFFDQHRYGHLSVKNTDVVNFDKDLVIPFFENNFLPAPSFRETEIVYGYLKKLTFYDIIYDEQWKEKFKNKEVDLWHLLNKRAEDKKELLYQYTENFSIEDYRIFFARIDVLSQKKKNYFSGYSTIKNSISYILIHLEKSDFKLFLNVFEVLFKYEYATHLFIDMVFKEIAYNEYKSLALRDLLLEGKINPECIVPLLTYLPADLITSGDYDIWVNYFRDEKTTWIYSIEKIFPKLQALNIHIEQALNSVLDYLMQKATASNLYVNNDFFKYLYKDHQSIFSDRLQDIQFLYLVLDRKDRHFDYSLEVLKLILSKNPTFINDLLAAAFDAKTFVSRTDLLENDFKKLWTLENRNEVFEDIIQFFSKFPSIFRNTHSEVGTAFQGSGENGLNFLRYLVNKTTDEKILRLAFNIVVSQFNESKFDFLDLLLQKNSNLAFFENLDLYTGSSISIGSRIPKIRQEIIVYEEVRDYIQTRNDIRYLEHLNYIEDRINACKAQIEWERKDEFMGE